MNGEGLAASDETSNFVESFSVLRRGRLRLTEREYRDEDADAAEGTWKS